MALFAHDIIIIGGGPAGISAGIWCADLGLRPLLIDGSVRLGGQLRWTHNPITNYPGVITKNGLELADRFAKQVDQAEIDLVVGRPVTSADLRSKSVVVDGKIFSSDALVIATGVRRRKLEIPGEQEFASRGILTSGSRDHDRVIGKTVVIVGGGDAALENALILSDVASKVYVIHRRGEFSARDEFVSKARAQANVEFIFDSIVTAISGGETVEQISIRNRIGEASTIDCGAVLIRIGVEPNTHLCRDQIDLDERGYILADRELKTNIPSVWAIGDVIGANSMTIARAVGEGAQAAKSIFDQLRG